MMSSWTHNLAICQDGSLRAETYQRKLVNADKADRFVICEFTGLLDKNGKEIYFGDILQTSNDGIDGADTWEPTETGYTVVQESKLTLGVDFTSWGVDFQGGDSMYEIRYCEVIGNIYEDQELIKDL